MYIECDMLRLFRAKRERKRQYISSKKMSKDTYCHCILASKAMQMIVCWVAKEQLILMQQ